MGLGLAIMDICIPSDLRLDEDEDLQLRFGNEWIAYQHGCGYGYRAGDLAPSGNPGAVCSFQNGATCVTKLDMVRTARRKGLSIVPAETHHQVR